MLDLGKTAICNEALARAGVTRTIQNVEEDKSPDATVCRLMFDQEHDGLLAEHNWRFAAKIESLSLLARATAGTGGIEFWKHAYKYPTDCVRLYAVVAKQGNHGVQPAWAEDLQPKVDNFIVSETFGMERRPIRGVDFEVVTTDRGRVILCNSDKAFGHYTSRALSLNSYPPLFRDALVYRLAAALVIAISGAKEAYMQQLLQFYSLRKAQAISADTGEVIERINMFPFYDEYR